MREEIKYLLDVTNAINLYLNNDHTCDINNIYPSIKTLFRYKTNNLPFSFCNKETFKLRGLCDSLKHRGITKAELSVSDNAKYSADGFFDYFSLFYLTLCNDKNIYYMTIKSGYRNNDINVYLTFEEIPRARRTSDNNDIEKELKKLCVTLSHLAELMDRLGLENYKILFNKACLSMTQNVFEPKQLQEQLLKICVFGNMNSFNDEPYVRAEEFGKLSEYLTLSEELWNLLLRCIALTTK